MKLKYFLIILYSLIAFSCFSQITKEQEELIETAEDYFYEGQYKEAMPLYSQLLSLYPSEAIYSFYYGACLVENNKEIDKAIKYLNYGAKKLSDQPLVFYYLGRAYHLSYQFNKAIQQYQEFQAKSTAKLSKEKQSEREINICNNGLNLVKYASPLIVLENKKTKESNFQYSYKLSDIGGKLVLKPDQFKTKPDLKQKAKELIFISDSGMVFFSSLGEKNRGHRDIYWANKDANGDFRPSQNLGPIINTPFDEDYPFLKADGKTLYFCSKGHNTMGGYDIFRSIYDSTAQAWSTPENLDFPTNTPYDDLLYVVDADDNLAYFASNRESQEEKLNIYKIQVDHNPVERSVGSVDEIKEIAKLNVTPVADNNTPKKDTIQAIATTEVAEFNEQGPKTDFSFEAVYENNINSSEAYTSALRKDIHLLQQSLKETQAKNILANNIAHQKLGQLREMQSQIEGIEQNSDTEALLNNTDYQKKIEDVTKVNTQAQIAVSVASQLSKEIKTREKELNITKVLLNDSSNSSTQELVQNINANRTFLQNNNKTYLSLNNKKREKEKEKEEKEAIVKAQKELTENANQDFNLLIADYQEAKKQNNQADMNAFKEDLIKEKAKVIQQNKTLKNHELELKKIEDEIRFLNQLNGELNNRENQKLASTNQTFDQALIAENANALNTQVEQMNQSRYENELENIYNNATAEILEDKQIIAENNETEDISNTEEIQDNTSDNTEPENAINPNIESNTELVAENTENPDIEAEHPEDDSAEINTTEINNTESLVNAQENNQESKQEENQENNQTELADNSIENKTQITKQDMVEISLVSIKSLPARRLFFDAKRQQQISDSLAVMAQEKEENVNLISNTEQQEIVKNEIEELKQLSKIKSRQAKQNYSKAQALESDYLAQNPSDSIIDSFIDKGLMAYETGKDENPNYIEYKKAAFTEHYYQNVLNDNNTKTVMNQNLLSNEDLPEERKIQIENELAEIEKANEKANIAIRKAKETQNIMKETLAEEGDILPQSKEEILVASTNIELESFIKLNKDQQKSNKKIIKQREQASEIIDIYNENLNTLRLLEDSLNQTEDIDLREDLAYEIEDIKDEIWVDFRKANELSEFSNIEERASLNNLLEEKRKYSNSDAVTKAYLYEKESEILEEKANFLRNNNRSNSTYNHSTISNLEKANLYELTANNRKKAALEIYASLPENTELIAENVSENNIEERTENLENIESENKPVVELLPDEEEVLAEYKELYAESEDKLIRANDNYRELENEKAALERTYLERDKKKQRAKIEALETKTKNKYQEAYRANLLANRKKQVLYAEKIRTSIANSNSEENIAIAKQYQLDADFYFSEAAKIEADSTQNIFDLRAQQKQRISLEAQALNAQELAFSALNKTPESDFLTSSGFVKIEPIEQNEKPIDPNIIQKVQTQRILDKLNISSSEAKSLTKTDKLKDEKAELEQKYIENQAEANLLRDSLEKVTEPKVRKKLDNKISALEEKSLSYLFSIASTSEPIHYEQYMIYKNRVKEYRIKDQNENAINGRALEKEANKAFRKAQSLRSKSFEVLSANKAYELLTEAQELELAALDKMEKAYTIYLDLKPLEEDVATYIAENTDTNAVNELGYTVIESEGQVEAYETPIIEEIDPVLSNDTTNQFIAASTDSLESQIPEDTLLAEESPLVDTIFVEPVDTITQSEFSENETILAENAETNATEEENEEELSIEEVNAIIAEASSNTTETINEASTSEEAPNEEIIIEETPNENNISEETSVEEIANENIVENNNETEEGLSTETPIIAENEISNNTSETSENNTINETIDNNTIVYDIDNGKPAFKMLSTPAYSDAQPIPINKTLPNGIVYKIQIGAFTRPIPQNSFRGLTPITGETRQNSRYVRYFVGLFDTYDAADAVLPHIQRTGYRDAFIVAYRNGERIAVYIARREDSREQNYQNIARSETQEVLKIVNENAEQTLGKTAAESLEPLNPSVNLTELTTTMYTVQIGVYKRHIAHERLNNLAPLYNDLTKSGLIRYTVGQFVDYNQAIQRRNEIRRTGIRDAFVTAYRNGERISIRTARQELASITANDAANNTVDITDNNTDNNNTDSNTDTSTEANNITSENEANNSVTETPIEETPNFNTEALHYCVQIGVFSNTVPVSIVSSFVQLSKLDELNHFPTSTGQTVYTIGNFKSLNRAKLLRQDLVEKGISDAFIIAFDGEKKVSIVEAQKVLQP